VTFCVVRTFRRLCNWFVCVCVSGTYDSILCGLRVFYQDERILLPMCVRVCLFVCLCVTSYGSVCNCVTIAMRYYRQVGCNGVVQHKKYSYPSLEQQTQFKMLNVCVMLGIPNPSIQLSQNDTHTHTHTHISPGYNSSCVLEQDAIFWRGIPPRRIPEFFRVERIRRRLQECFLRRKKCSTKQAVLYNCIHNYGPIISGIVVVHPYSYPKLGTTRLE